MFLQGQVSWKEACELSSFFYSYSTSIPVASVTSAWAISCGNTLPKLPLRLHKSSAVRASQSAHMVWILNEKLGGNMNAVVGDLSSSGTVSFEQFFEIFSQSYHASFFCNFQVGRTAFKHLFDFETEPSTSFLCTIPIRAAARLTAVTDILQFDTRK